MKAIVHTQEIKRPYSGQTIGWRLVAAIPNMAGQMFGKETPSFRKPFLLHTSSDMGAGGDKKIVESFYGELHRLGFDEFETA